MNSLAKINDFLSSLVLKTKWPVGGLSLCLIGLAGSGCHSVESPVASGVGQVANSSALSAEQTIIKGLWQQTDQVIAKMGRPQRLYKVVPAKTALIVVDMQNGFCLPTACIEIPDSRKIVPNINTIAAACRTADIPVYWIRLNNSSSSNTAGLWPLFQPRSPSSPDRPNPPEVFQDSGPATEVYKELFVNDSVDVQVSKNRYSALIPGSSSLGKLLKDAGRDTLIVTGIGTDVCCESTARDAMMLDLKVIFVADATATVNPVFHEVTLMHVKMFFGDVVSTEELLGEVRNIKK